MALPLLHPAQLSGAGVCCQQEAQSGFSGSAQAVREETPDQRVLQGGGFPGQRLHLPHSILEGDAAWPRS